MSRRCFAGRLLARAVCLSLLASGLPGSQQALLAGPVDAAVLREPAVTVVRHRLPGAVILARGGTPMADQPGLVLAVLDPDKPVTLSEPGRDEDRDHR